MLNNMELKSMRIFIACGYTDLRYGIDGLARKGQEAFELNPFEKNIVNGK